TSPALPVARATAPVSRRLLAPAPAARSAGAGAPARRAAGSSPAPGPRSGVLPSAGPGRSLASDTFADTIAPLATRGGHNELGFLSRLIHEPGLLEQRVDRLLVVDPLLVEVDGVHKEVERVLDVVDDPLHVLLALHR